MYYSNNKYKNIPIPKEFIDIYSKYPDALCYKYKEFSINEEKLQELKDAECNNKIYEMLDKNAKEIIFNECVHKDSPEYLEYKEKYLKEREELLAKLR